jgi:hypothetical protein
MVHFIVFNAHLINSILDFTPIFSSILPQSKREIKVHFERFACRSC